MGFRAWSAQCLLGRLPRVRSGHKARWLGRWPKGSPCERLDQGSNPASLVQKLVTAFLLRAAAPGAQIQRPHERPRPGRAPRPSGRASSRLDGLPGQEAAEEPRVSRERRAHPQFPLRAAGHPGLEQKLVGDGGRSRGRRLGPWVGAQEPRSKGLRRPHERGKNSWRSTQSLGSLRLPAAVSVWPSHRQAAYRTLGLAGPWSAKRRFLNAFQVQREREIERDREREGNQLLFSPLGDALQRAARRVLTGGSSGLISPAPPI